jgi:hypothetical protein
VLLKSDFFLFLSIFRRSFIFRCKSAGRSSPKIGQISQEGSLRSPTCGWSSLHPLSKQNFKRRLVNTYTDQTLINTYILSPPQGLNTRMSFEQLMRSNETVKFSLTPGPCLESSDSPTVCTYLIFSFPKEVVCGFCTDHQPSILTHS